MARSAGPPEGYVDVASRWQKAKAEHPEARLEGSYEMHLVGDQWYVAYTARAYRSPSDLTPGVGTAWEPVPGRTNFTRDSELQNAETSAWGRALIAAGMADASNGIASADEVRNRQGHAEAPPETSGKSETGGPPVLRPQAGDLRSFKARVRELAERNGRDADELRHTIVSRATDGRTSSSDEVSKAELPECWNEYREAVRVIEGAGA